MKNSMLLLIFCVGFNLFGQDDSISLNKEAYNQSAVISNESLSGNDFFYKYKQARVFSLNPMLKQDDNDLLGAEIVLDLFFEKSYTASIESVKRDINNTLVVKASIKNYLAAFCIITTNADGISSLRIEIPQLAESYNTITDPETRNLYLAQLDLERLDEFRCKTIDIDLDDSITRIENPLPFNNPDEVAEIDIMVVYTPAAEAYAIANNGGMNNVIATFMTTSQTVMDNSEVGVVFNLVYSQLINYTETSDSGLDLIRLANVADGIMDEVHAWRNNFNADLVTLITTNQDVSGVAYTMHDPEGIPELGFSLLNLPGIINKPYAPVHEFGHNMGCHHHKLQNFQPGPGLFDYSAGWRWTSNDNNRYSSVSTYPSGQYFDDGLDHIRVPYFSNPDVYYIGVPTGDPEDGDNARSIREIKHVIAAYSDFLGTASFNQERITISPNPTSGILEISTRSPITGLKVFDNLGKLLQKSLTSFLDLGGYASGIYFIQVETSEGSSVKKVVKL